MVVSMRGADPDVLRVVAARLVGGDPLDLEARRLAAGALLGVAAAAEAADERRARRDEALAALVASYASASLEHGCRQALGFLSRYEAGRWRRDQCLAEAPAHYSPRDQAAFAALQHGPVPRTTRRLRSIVTAVEKTLKHNALASTNGR